MIQTYKAMSGEAAMIENNEQCENCLKEIPESKIATHFAYCRRNMKKCEKCSNMFDINYPSDHEEEFHKKAACPYCFEETPQTELQQHEENCIMKPKRCEYCDLGVPLAEFKEHFKACEARTNRCERCGKSVQNKDFYAHISTCEVIQVAEEENQNPSRATLKRARHQSSSQFLTENSQPRKMYKQAPSQREVQAASKLYNQPFSKTTKKEKAIKPKQATEKPNEVIEINDEEGNAGPESEKVPEPEKIHHLAEEPIDLEQEEPEKRIGRRAEKRLERDEKKSSEQNLRRSKRAENKMQASQ